ncbi:MAG: regulatory signaling modulator protein AmpE [Stagnimonas sp.]|nr:regulatory signaling modulator protein AmpE [Stagnimonas sp.]
MNFLAVLAALAAERFLPHGLGFGEPRLLRALLRGLDRSRPGAALARSALLPWLLTAAAVAVTALIQYRLAGSLAGGLFGGLLLFLCLGPRDLADEVGQLLAARQRGDRPAVIRLARQLQHGPEPDDSHRSLLGALFIQSHERLFGVLLAFLTVGPAGAVFYRLASRLPAQVEALEPDTAAARAAAQLHGLAAWLPVRLTALLFALAGSMDDAMTAWRRLGELDFRHGWRSHSWAVLAEVGCGALASEEAEGSKPVAPKLDAALREVLRMQTRALLILLAGFAVFTTGTLF